MSVDGLRLALDEIAARHESLGTTFPLRDGEHRQPVAPLLDAYRSQVDVAVGRQWKDRAASLSAETGY